MIALHEAVASGANGSASRAELAVVTERVRSEVLSQVADEFDAVHSIERAQEVGSVDDIIPAAELRPRLIAAVGAGIAKATSP